MGEGKGTGFQADGAAVLVVGGDELGECRLEAICISHADPWSGRSWSGGQDSCGSEGRRGAGEGASPHGILRWCWLGVVR
ncbi:hypothetical protein ACWDZ6_24575 [Streptomyces sp. NPDC002926]